jgi:hypothetical protein
MSRKPVKMLFDLPVSSRSDVGVDRPCDFRVHRAETGDNDLFSAQEPTLPYNPSA